MPSPARNKQREEGEMLADKKNRGMVRGPRGGRSENRKSEKRKSRGLSDQKTRSNLVPRSRGKS